MSRVWVLRSVHCVAAGAVVCLLLVLALGFYGKACESEAAPEPPPGMVLIPAGEFAMGSHEGEEDEQPVHVVHVEAFYMDRHPVTNLDYKKFIDATGCKPPYNWLKGEYPDGAGDQPVRLVSWEDAAAYAAWAGKRLSTEAEWEKAARGGLVGRQYPWGDEIKPANARYASRLGPVAVGQYPSSGYGLLDMAGNIWEWTADWYDPEYYYYSPARNPQGPPEGLYRVVRGGSWYDHPAYLRCAFRNWAKPSALSLTVGFRCAKSLPRVDAQPGPAKPLETTPLKVGDCAPDFVLPDQNNLSVRLSDQWKKKNLVLLFWGRAFTGGAKRELQAYKVDYQFFESAEADIIGVSEEDPAVNKKFREDTGAQFPLLSDRRGEIARHYGVWLERWDTARRTTFVIDRQGVIQYVQQGASSADSEQALDFCLKAFVHKELPAANTR